MKTSYQAKLSDNSNIYFIAHDDHEAAEQGRRFAELTRQHLLDIVIMKDYYPNYWEEVEALPDDVIPMLSYSEVISEWAGSWSLPNGINSIIRARSADGSVKEFAYKSATAAFKRITNLIETDHEVLFITDEYCHHIDAADYY